MAAVITMTSDGEFGTKPANAAFITLATLAGDDSYPVGGYDIGALLDLKDYLKDHTLVHVIAQEDENYRYVFVQASGKLKFLNLDTGAEIGDTTDVQAATAVPLVIFSQ